MSTVAVLPQRVVESAPVVDLDAAERAAAALLVALGVDVSTESTVRTPRRMARAYAELLAVQDVELTTFPNDGNYAELVLVKDIEFRSVCEHHMLPFTGVAHVGCLPGDRILGLSKFARLVDHVASRPQTQERLTQQIADELQRHLQPRGVGVLVEAEHSCLSLRGARARGARTVTSALAGEVKADRALREEFLALARGSRERS